LNGFEVSARDVGTRAVAGANAALVVLNAEASEEAALDGAAGNETGGLYIGLLITSLYMGVSVNTLENSASFFFSRTLSVMALLICEVLLDVFQGSTRL
jgi:hypothetical protein